MLTIPSLLLSAAVLALWARSLTIADLLSHARATNINGRYALREWIVLSGGGFVSIGRVDTVPTDDAAAPWMQDLHRRSGLGWSFGPVESFPPSWEGVVEGLGRIGREIADPD